jgi:hypothetical protein
MQGCFIEIHGEPPVNGSQRISCLNRKQSGTPQREDKSRGTKPGRKAIAAHLPRVEVLHDLADADRCCACGSPLNAIGSKR